MLTWYLKIQHKTGSENKILQSCIATLITSVNKDSAMGILFLFTVVVVVVVV